MQHRIDLDHVRIEDDQGKRWKPVPIRDWRWTQFVIGLFAFALFRFDDSAWRWMYLVLAFVQGFNLVFDFFHERWLKSVAKKVPMLLVLVFLGCTGAPPADDVDWRPILFPTLYPEGEAHGYPCKGD